jgi:hypothetical protein
MTTSVEVWAPAFLWFSPQKGLGFVPDKRGIKPEQLKNVDPPSADLIPVTKFLSRHLTVDFCFEQHTGKTWCKLCEDSVEGSRETHHSRHMKELQKFLAHRQSATKEADKFYPNPCEGCGELMPKKPGRNPKLCASCKGAPSN